MLGASELIELDKSDDECNEYGCKNAGVGVGEAPEAFVSKHAFQRVVMISAAVLNSGSIIPALKALRPESLFHGGVFAYYLTKISLGD